MSKSKFLSKTLLAILLLQLGCTKKVNHPSQIKVPCIIETKVNIELEVDDVDDLRFVEMHFYQDSSVIGGDISRREHFQNKLLKHQYVFYLKYPNPITLLRKMYYTDGEVVEVVEELK